MEDIIYDLCVVGAGMFGSAAARHASTYAGVKVCLIGPAEPKYEDRASREIFGAHYDEGRIAYILDNDIPTEILAKHAMSRYRELEQLSGIAFYSPVGYLYIGKRDSLSIYKKQLAAEIANVPIIDLSYNDIFKTRFPYININKNDHPLLDDTGAGHISPRNMVAAQIKMAQKQGCQLIEDIVNEVKPLTNGIHEIITEKGEIIKSKRVLLCTGAFTNFKKFPIPKLKMQLNKETFSLARISDTEASRLSAMPTITYSRPDERHGFYLLPPIKYPDGIKFEEITSSTCVSCDNPIGQPYLDRILPTVTVAVVGKGRGAKVSDEIGRIAATLSLTGKWDSELPKCLFRAIFDDE